MTFYFQKFLTPRIFSGCVWGECWITSHFIVVLATVCFCHKDGSSWGQRKECLHKREVGWHYLCSISLYRAETLWDKRPKFQNRRKTTPAPEGKCIVRYFWMIPNSQNALKTNPTTWYNRRHMHNTRKVRPFQSVRTIARGGHVHCFEGYNLVSARQKQSAWRQRE